VTDTQPAVAGSYNADDFTTLEGLDAVRRRMGMYVGGNSSAALMHLVYEILDNSVDEALAGFCTRIEVTLHPDGSVEISDDGRGIPTDINTKAGVSAVMLATSRLHSGGKISGSGYKVSGGLNGVGAAVVNALSERFDVTVYRDGKKHELSFRRGKPVIYDGPGTDAKHKPAVDVRATGPAPKGFTGTTIRFWPDYVLFAKEAVMEREALVDRARKSAFLVPKLTVNFRDLRSEQPYEESFHFEGGVRDMVDFLTPGKPLSEIMYIAGVGQFTETIPLMDDSGTMVNTEVERDLEVQVALRWDTGYDTNVHSFVNIVSTHQGGTHVKGFERGLLGAIRKGYDGTRLMRATEDPVTLDDVTEGLTAVISVSLPEPQFIGQTKSELGTAAALKIVQDVVAAGIKNWIEAPKTKVQARTVLEKVANAARARVASRTQREAARRKTALEGASMPAKLVDCRAIGVDRSELFLVEGDSALGSARQGRNSEYQALLPLRGKILNVQKASLADMLKNTECAAIIQSIGAGSGRSFDLEQMRYGRVMLMADADVDGSHIRALLITLFWKYMRPVIEDGRLYAAMPPLHKIEVLGRSKETLYTYTAEEMEAVIARLTKAGKKIKSPVQRFKGLGEMDAEELWETTMDPQTRSVRRISADDAHAAEAMLELLMGSDVESRRNYLIDNAHLVDWEAVDA
jgi:DNA gyrase subunit B